MPKLGFAALAESRRARAGALVALVIFAVGCGGSQKPNPLPAEEPMDPSGSSSSSGATPTTTAASTNDSSSSADPSAGLSMADPSAGAGATPTPAPTPDTTDSDPKGKGKGKRGKGKGKGAKGELSAAECQQLSNKGIELLGASMGMTDPSMMSQLKAQAAGDPNFGGMQTECVKSTTRAQYKCGMSATSKDAWEACLK